MTTADTVFTSQVPRRKRHQSHHTEEVEHRNHRHCGDEEPKTRKYRYRSLEPYLRDFFYWYGGFAYEKRWWLFIVPVLLTPVLGVGFLWFGELRVDDPAYVFTPKDARWKHELSTFVNLWPLDENKFQPGKSFEPRRFVNVLCKAADGGDVLRPEILDEIQLLNKFIMENITVPTRDGQFNLSYQDLCLSYDWVCGGNEHIAMFKEMEQLGRVIDLTFPKGGNKDTPVYLGTVLGDIILNKSDNHVAEAKITQLFYFLKQEPENVRQYSTDFEYAVERFILHGFESRLITLSFAHYQSLKDGLEENANRFSFNFFVSFSVLSVFCVCCAFRLQKSAFCGIDWVRSKPYVACAGLFNTLISLISSFGLMMLIGIPYNVINTIIPFLIIAIGIDDMFIMTACYDQVDSYLPVKVRMAEMMRNAGVAVSITNVTDILSFLIGCLTDLPGVELFCLYAFVCVLFCYIYQLTFFTGFMALMSVAEGQNRHCLLLYKMDDNNNDRLDGQKLRKTRDVLKTPAEEVEEPISDVKKGKIYLVPSPPPPVFAFGSPEEEEKIERTVRSRPSPLLPSFYNERFWYRNDDSGSYAYRATDCGTLERHNAATTLERQKKGSSGLHDVPPSEPANNESGNYTRNIVVGDWQRRRARMDVNAELSLMAPHHLKIPSSEDAVTEEVEVSTSGCTSDIIMTTLSTSSASSSSSGIADSASSSDGSVRTERKATVTAIHPMDDKKKSKKASKADRDSNGSANVLTSSHDSGADLSSPSPSAEDRMGRREAAPLRTTTTFHYLGANAEHYIPASKKANNLQDRHNRHHHRHTASKNRTHLFFSRFYGPWLLTAGSRMGVVLFYLVYVAFALLGCAQFREGLEPSHLVTADHYIARYFADIKLFWKRGAQLHVVVLEPPNLVDPVEREKLMQLVASFENTEYTMGREGTVFFLFEYINYLNQLNAELENTERIWRQKLRSWLKYTGGSEQWERDIVYVNGTGDFKAYRFQVAMKNIVEPNQHKLATKMLREVADRQPFHVEIYHEAFPFADQYLIILPSTYRNVLISLSVMTVIAFLLIPSIPSAILIVISIVSISMGVFGYMTFWGVNLDAISMISIIMSIGFAVDLSAHIVYAFVTAHGDTHERIIGALEHLGWPIFQGATSTIFGISVLYTVDAYIILTFFKTIWLTMVLGLVHGLVFIPVMLSFIPISFFQIPKNI